MEIGVPKTFDDAMAEGISPNRYRYIDENKEHMHTLDGKPLYGTSSVLKIINKPLTWWAAGMALKPLGWVNAKTRLPSGKYISADPEVRREAALAGMDLIASLTHEEYIKLLDDCYRAHDNVKNEAAVKGTDRHALLEEYVKHCMTVHNGTPVKLDSVKFPDLVEIAPFVNWAVDNIKQFLWSEVNCYSEVLWTGGIADVGWLDKQDRVIAGDFKSSKEAYFEQFLQIGGYDIELTENGGLDKDGNKIFTLPAPIKGYCVLPFGADTLIPNLQYDVDAYRNGFKAALTLHKLQVSF